MKKPTDDQIGQYSKELRLPVFRHHFKEIARQSASEGADYEVFLLRLLEMEYEKRIENRKSVAIRQAGFPARMYLNELKREHLPQEAQQKLPLLERMDFIKSGQNIVLSGNPGTGKTHIAVGLGLKACIQGYKVLFTTVHKLLTQLRESHSQRTLRNSEARFEKWDLVICDEFGYVSFDKQGSELLFNHLSLRTGRNAAIITTNLGFERWEESLGTPY